jgi:hypothetical protein
LGRLGLLLRRLRLLQRRLGLLRLRLWWRWSSAECRACGATANVSAACVDRPREMVRQAKPARSNHDEKLCILKSMVF